MPKEEMMKTNKVTKLGVSLLSVAVLGVVAPVLTDESVFGISIVKAEETRPLKYTIAYYDKDTGKEIAPRKTGTINPGELSIFIKILMAIRWSRILMSGCPVLMQPTA